MPHQKSSDYKETAVQYYLVEDKTQEEIIYELSYKMGVLNEKRCKNFYETESGIKNIWIPNEIDIGRQQMIIGIEGHKIQLPDSITDDLLKHYQNFKYYGIPKVYPEFVI